MKGNDDVIKEFNQYVNMSATELDNWLKTDDSKNAGWSQDGSSDDSVGRDSGRKIVEILKANPKKEPQKYTEEQIQHMRKVAAYCKRHLAQEGKSLREKPSKEAKQSKSYISLKNWGHDPLKNTNKGSNENDGQKDTKITAGSKRKAGNNQEGKAKKQETENSNNSSSRESRAKARNERKEKQEQNGSSNQQTKANTEDGEGQKARSGKKATKGPQPGQSVSWNWGAGQPTGKVLDVKGEKTTVTTKRGSKVSRDGDPQDPAVVIDTGKSKAVKSNHELN